MLSAVVMGLTYVLDSYFDPIAVFPVKWCNCVSESECCGIKNYLLWQEIHLTFFFKVLLYSVFSRRILR